MKRLYSTSTTSEMSLPPPPAPPPAPPIPLPPSPMPDHDSASTTEDEEDDDAASGGGASLDIDLRADVLQLEPNLEGKALLSSFVTPPSHPPEAANWATGYSENHLLDVLSQFCGTKVRAIPQISLLRAHISGAL